MTDPYDSPNPARPASATLLGGVLYVVSGGCALAVVATWAGTLAGMLQLEASTALFVFLFALLVTVGLGTVGIAALGGARAALWPEIHGLRAWALRRIEAAYERHGLASAPAGDPGPFELHDVPALADILAHIDPDSYPERFQQLLVAVKRAVEESPPPAPRTPS